MLTICFVSSTPHGGMSAVGLRPHALEHNALCAPRIDRYIQRSRVESGITGWVQVNGFRGDQEHGIVGIRHEFAPFGQAGIMLDENE